MGGGRGEIMKAGRWGEGGTAGQIEGEGERQRYFVARAPLGVPIHNDIHVHPCIHPAWPAKIWLHKQLSL